MSKTMNNRIKEIILEYLNLEVVDYVEDSDTNLIFSDEKIRHEKDVLDETIQSMKEELNEALDDFNFYYAKKITDDLESLAIYYEENWLA